MTIVEKSNSLATTKEKIWLAVFGALFLLALIFVISMLIPSSMDWPDTFYPASQELLHGRSPYNVTTFLSVPWTLVPLLPFALLPERMGSAALFIVSTLVYA